MMRNGSWWTIRAGVLAVVMSGCAYEAPPATSATNQSLVAAPTSEDPGSEPGGGSTGGTSIEPEGPAVSCVEDGENVPMPPELQASFQEASTANATPAAAAESAAVCSDAEQNRLAEPDWCYPPRGSIWFCGGGLCIALGGNRAVQCELIFGLCMRVRIQPNCA